MLHLKHYIKTSDVIKTKLGLPIPMTYYAKNGEQKRLMLSIDYIKPYHKYHWKSFLRYKCCFRCQRIRQIHDRCFRKGSLEDNQNFDSGTPGLHVPTLDFSRKRISRKDHHRKWTRPDNRERRVARRRRR